MRKLIYASGLFSMLFLLTACPYSSEYALNEPNETVKKEYLGTWLQEGESEHPSYWVISKLTDKTYTFEDHEYNDNEKGYNVKKYAGHFTKMGTVNFLNLKEESDSKYSFFKIELSDDKKQMVIYEVTDNIDETFSNAGDLKAFFDQHKDLSFFYNKDEKKYKKK